jgi:hypothetical protein
VNDIIGILGVCQIFNNAVSSTIINGSENINIKIYKTIAILEDGCLLG